MKFYTINIKWRNTRTHTRTKHKKAKWGTTWNIYTRTHIKPLGTQCLNTHTHKLWVVNFTQFDSQGAAVITTECVSTCPCLITNRKQLRDEIQHTHTSSFFFFLINVCLIRLSVTFHTRLCLSLYISTQSLYTSLSLTQKPPLSHQEVQKNSAQSYPKANNVLGPSVCLSAHDSAFTPAVNCGQKNEDQPQL